VVTWHGGVTSSSLAVEVRGKDRRSLAGWCERRRAVKDGRIQVVAVGLGCSSNVSALLMRVRGVDWLTTGTDVDTEDFGLLDPMAADSERSDDEAHDFSSVNESSNVALVSNIVNCKTTTTTKCITRNNIRPVTAAASSIN